MASATAPAASGPLRVPVWYDPASTLCYVAHRVMERMAPDLEELGVELAWRPLDLAALLHRRRGSAVSTAARGNALRVARELRVPVRMPGAWIDSRPAMAVALCLDDPAAEAAWRERVFSAVFEDGRDPGEAGELERLQRDLGLAVPGAERQRAGETLVRRTREAARAMVSGVPTFMLGEWPFGGIQEDATMRHFLSRFVERSRRGSPGAGREER